MVERGGKQFIPSLKVLMLLAILLAGWLGAGHWYHVHLINQQRLKVDHLLSEYAHSVSSLLNLRLGQIGALVALARSDIIPNNLSFNESQKKVEILLASQGESVRGLRAMGLAPGGTINIIAPLTENRKAIGHNLLTDHRLGVRDKVLQAIRTRQLTLSDPYELRQKGFGLVARQALFVEDRFWGLAFLVLDIPPILEEVGLYALQTPLKIALHTDSGLTFHGDPALQFSNSVRVRIPLPDGSWHLRGEPAAGWQNAIGKDLLIFRLGTAALCGLLLGAALLKIRERTLQHQLADQSGVKNAKAEAMLLRTSWLPPLLFTVALLLAGFSLYRFVLNIQYEDQQNKLARTLDTVATTIRNNLESDVTYLSLLAKEKGRGALDASIFHPHVSRYLADHPTLSQVLFTAATPTVLWTAPVASKEKAFALEEANPESLRAFHLAREKRKPTYSRIFEKDQKFMIEMYLPAFQNGTFIGHFVAVYTLDRILSQAVSSNLRRSYRFELQDNKGTSLSTIEHPLQGTEENLRASTNLLRDLSGLALSIQAYPIPKRPGIFLIITLSLGLMFGVALSIWLLHRELARRKHIEEQLRATQSKLLHQARQLEELSRRDPLTGLFNQRAFYELLEREISFARRHQFDLCLAYTDLNNFKQVNDTLGHQAGDHILEDVGLAFSQSIRQEDLGCRYGGDEFALIMPKTDIPQAKLIVERIISRFDLTSNQGVTFSFGITKLERDRMENADHLVRRADKLMYEAKNRAKKNGAHEICCSATP